MNEFLKMDIFFAMTTAVVVLIGIFSLVALFYIIKILRSVDHVADNVSKESDSLREDITILRHKVRDEGMKMQHLLDFFAGIKNRKEKHKKTKE